MIRLRTHSSYIRDTGVALAALAIWMLCLLAPLHQSAGTLRDMAKAGVDISGAWSLCVTLAEGDVDPAKSVPDCPAQGVSKSGLAHGPAPVVIAAVWDLSGHIAPTPSPQRPRAQARLGPIQPRAPPLTI
ncbi:hypothetical protein ACP2AV_14935 [Aliiroseovarius sp. PTFE2010]|uniref:hypothetical protein n=1 Tax=Aliiroseovarius sp. PTFE2010 TaxID=3417190 RepID=UPI003CF573E7